MGRRRLSSRPRGATDPSVCGGPLALPDTTTGGDQWYEKDCNWCFRAAVPKMPALPAMGCRCRPYTTTLQQCSRFGRAIDRQAEHKAGHHLSKVLLLHPHPLASQEMLASARLAAVTAPALVIMGAPLNPATRAPSVRSSGCTSSHIFFLSTWLGLAASP